MKTVNKIAMSFAAIMSLGLADAYAQTDPMASGMGLGMMHGQMMQGQRIGKSSHMKIMRELMTPAERLGMMDKMIDAKTTEERKAIMTNKHIEMEKRAAEKGLALPTHNSKMMFDDMCG